jgi:hypothetical protein
MRTFLSVSHVLEQCKTKAYCGITRLLATGMERGCRFQLLEFALLDVFIRFFRWHPGWFSCASYYLFLLASKLAVASIKVCGE